jgi:hypothetical protein
LLLLEVYSWLNAPMLERIIELLSSFAAVFSSRTPGVQALDKEQEEVSLALSVHVSSFTLCFFAPNAAIGLQLLSGVAIDELYSDFYSQRGPRNQPTCPPFIKVQRNLDETSLRVYIERATVHSMASEDTGGSIEIVDGGHADALRISCVLNVCLDLRSLSNDLPEKIAAVIDQSKLPFVNTAGIGRTVSTAGTVKGSEIAIAGIVQVKVSPISLRSATGIASSFSVYSRPPTSSGAFKVCIAGLNVQFLGPLALKCSDIKLLHILNDNASSFAIGSIASLSLHGGSEWPFISTSNSETNAIAFAIADNCRAGSEAAGKKQFILHTAGIILAEDFLRAKPIWSEFDYIKDCMAVEPAGDAAAESLAVHVSGKELLIMHIPLNEHLEIDGWAAAIHILSLSITAPEPAEVIANIAGVSIHLKESGLAFKGLQSPLSVPTWLREKGFLLIAREEQMHCRRQLSTISSLAFESLSLHTRSLHVNLSKNSAALIKKLTELPVWRSAEVARGNNVAMAPVAIEEALEYDIRDPDEPHSPLNGETPSLTSKDLSLTT